MLFSLTNNNMEIERGQLQEQVLFQKHWPPNAVLCLCGSHMQRSNTPIKR